jgi:hypothetical protein
VNSFTKAADASSWASTLNGIAAHAYASPGAGMAGPSVVPQYGPGASRFQPNRQSHHSFSSVSGPAVAGVTFFPKNGQLQDGPSQGTQAGFCFGKLGPESPSSKAAGRHVKPSSPVKKPGAAAATGRSNPSSPSAPLPEAATAGAHAPPSFPGFAATDSSGSSKLDATAGPQATPAPCFANPMPSSQPAPSPEPMSTSTPWQGPSRAFGTPLSAMPMETTGGPFYRADASAATAEEAEETEPVKRLFDTPGIAGMSPGDSSVKGSQESSFSFHLGERALGQACLCRSGMY